MTVDQIDTRLVSEDVALPRRSADGLAAVMQDARLSAPFGGGRTGASVGAVTRVKASMALVDNPIVRYLRKEGLGH